VINRKISILLNKIIAVKFHSLALILLLTISSLIATPQAAYSQSLNDTIKVNVHSPRKASLYSAILPGLGQVYNRQYWKVPVLYAGIATLTYFFIFNSGRYHNYQTEYIARVNNDSTNFNTSYAIYSDNTILLLKNYYQRNLELTYIISGLVYLLNIVDASVYAHLFTFDVSNDLSLRIDPMFNNYALRFGSPPAAGLRLTFRF